ncbi:hypothetical protein [Streptomyces sp. NPDC016845]|uniref:hypothetical protein n=1 Tax=Streptomyces sp. NPDC016845 TaxID=3364972 RepID=UPI00378C5A25
MPTPDTLMTPDADARRPASDVSEGTASTMQAAMGSAAGPDRQLRRLVVCSDWARSRSPAVPAPTAPPTAKALWEEFQDITDHRECAENNDPVLSHDPVEIRDSAEPIEPTDRALPIEPIESAEPTEPTDSTEPADPIDNTESCDHKDSTEPEEGRRTDRTGSFVMR